MSFGRTRNEAPFSGLEITSHLWWEEVPGGAARTRPFQGLFSQVERPRKETRVDAGRDRIVGSPATPARSLEPPRKPTPFRRGRNGIRPAYVPRQATRVL